VFRLADLFRGVRAVSRLTAVGMALTSMACGSEAVDPGNDGDLAGTHQMVSIDSHDVPHTFTDAAGSKLTIFGGSLAFYGDGTFELSYQGKLNANEFDLGDSGTYTVSGLVVTFQSDYDGEVYNGSVLDTITLSKKIAGVMFTMGFNVN